MSLFTPPPLLIRCYVGYWFFLLKLFIIIIFNILKQGALIYIDKRMLPIYLLLLLPPFKSFIMGSFFFFLNCFFHIPFGNYLFTVNSFRFLWLTHLYFTWMLVYLGIKLLTNGIFLQHTEDIIIFMASHLQCVDFEQSDTHWSHWWLSGEGNIQRPAYTPKGGRKKDEGIAMSRSRRQNNMEWMGWGGISEIPKVCT